MAHLVTSLERFIQTYPSLHGLAKAKTEAREEGLVAFVAPTARGSPTHSLWRRGSGSYHTYNRYRQRHSWWGVTALEANGDELPSRRLATVHRLPMP